MKTRAVALLLLLAVWSAVAYGNRRVEFMNPALLGPLEVFRRD